MTEKRYEILTVVLETENYRDIGGRTRVGRALAVHYINKNNEPDCKFYGYRDTKYARLADLPTVKIKLHPHSNPHLIKNSNGEPDTIVLGDEHWKHIQVNHVTHP